MFSFFIDFVFCVCYYVYIGDDMERFQYKDIRCKFQYLCEREYTYLSVDRVNNIVCKIFEPDYVFSMFDSGYDLEKLVLEGSKLVNSDDIIIPNGIVYNKYFAGYLMDYFNGVSVYNYFKKNRVDSLKLVSIYKKIESAVKRCDNIVFPDLLTDGNILINDKLDIKLIDFDGLQVSQFSTPVFSRDMGNKSIYNDTKYKCGDLYTKELDVKSLIYLYIRLLLNVEMGFLDDYDGLEQEYQVNKFFKDYGVDNDNLVHKIYSLYEYNEENIYLGDTVDEIYDNYVVDVVLNNGRYIKKLIRK